MIIKSIIPLMLNLLYNHIINSTLMKDQRNIYQLIQQHKNINIHKEKMKD